MAPVLFISIFLLPLTARAEIKGGSVELSPFAGYNFFETRQNLVDRPVFGGRIGYNFTEHFGIEATGEFMRSKVDDKSKTFTQEGEFTYPADRVDIIMYHLDLIFHFMPEGKFNPFIVAGYGAANYSPKINNKNMSDIDFGIGAKYWLADNIALRLDVRDNMIYDEAIHNVQTTLGVVFRFGGKSKTAAAEPPPPPVPAPIPPPASPTAALTVTPATVTQGQSAILTWRSENASGCEIQPDIGRIATGGVKTITPASSTSYSLSCSGAGGTATSAAYVTVEIPPPPPPAPLPPQAEAAAKRFCSKPAVLAVNFDTAKTYIKPQYHDELKTVGDFLTYFPNARGEISGHTDTVGTKAYNQVLSQARADSVKKYIVEKFGIDPARIETKGYDFSRPVASNKTEAGRAKNRRIEANFTCD